MSVPPSAKIQLLRTPSLGLCLCYWQILVKKGALRDFERPITSSCRGANGLFCSNIFLSMTLLSDDTDTKTLRDLRTKHNLPSLQLFTSELNLYEWTGFPSTFVQCMQALNETKNAHMHPFYW